MKPRMTDVVLPPTFEQTAGAGAPTPGPWKTRLRHATITIYGADGIQVLETSWHPEIRKSYPLKAEAIANAKLAAAAPELLAALTECHRRLKMDLGEILHLRGWLSSSELAERKVQDEVADEADRQAIDQAAAAIAKAKAGA